MVRLQRWALVWWGLVLAGCGGLAGPRQETPAEVEVESLAGADPGALTGAPRWVWHYDGPSEERPAGIAHDREGNVIVAVNFATELRQGPQGVPRGEPVETMGSDFGTFAIIKYRPEGTLLWIRTFGAIPPAGERRASSFVSALTVDHAGNILFSGSNTGSIDFGTGLLSTGLFLVKLAPNGSPVFARPFTRLTSTTAFLARELATDREGHIALAGSLQGTVDLGGGPVAGDGNALLATFDPAGAFRWSFVEVQFSFGNGVVADHEGHLYLCGTLQTDLFPPFDIIPFVYAFSPTGTRRWSRRLGTTNGQGLDIATHGNRVVVVGRIAAPLTFQGRTLEPTGASDAFVVAFTRAGDERWARHFGVSAEAVAMDPRDGVVVTGAYEDGDNLGRGPLHGVPGSAANLYVAKFDRIRGAPRWTRGFASEGAFGVEVSADRQGRSGVTGFHTAPVDFGFGVLLPAVQNGFLLGLER